MSVALRVILKFFVDDGEKRWTLLDVAEIYTPNACVDTKKYSLLTCAGKKIRVYLTHDVVDDVLLKSVI